MEKNSYKELQIEAKTENLDHVLDFVDKFLEENDVSFKNIMSINLSVEEIFVNVANYAYAPSIGNALIKINMDNDNVVISILDNGIEFNPLLKEDPNVHSDINDRNIGGLGIFLVKKYMDDCSYIRDKDANIFTMIKKVKNV